MNIEEVKKVINKICPSMMSHENFMKNIVDKYCDGEFVDVKAISDDEYDAWCNVREVIGTATVGQVIKHLKENFKPTDKLCYMDCVEGCKNDCTYVTKSQLGDRFFYYVKNLKTLHNDEDDLYPYVKDEDVVVC